MGMLLINYAPGVVAIQKCANTSHGSEFATAHLPHALRGWVFAILAASSHFGRLRGSSLDLVTELYVLSLC